MTVFNLKIKETVLSKERGSLNSVEVTNKSLFTYFGADNFNPFVLNAIADQHLPVTGTLSIDISNTFDDVDIDRGDVITVTAVSSDPDICGASVVDDELILTGHGTGQTTVTITARDLFNLFIP